MVSVSRRFFQVWGADGSIFTGEDFFRFGVLFDDVEGIFIRVITYFVEGANNLAISKAMTV